MSATSTLLSSLSGRKLKAKLGANLNESVASGPSAFARAQLEKMGWTEGTGLGKKRDGMATHIRVTKRGDGQALGASNADNITPLVTGDQWWKSSVGDTLARLRDKQKKKPKKEKGDDNNNNNKKNKKKKKSGKKRKLEYTDEELFEATGGARFGMRAQTQQRGKWNRAEDAITEDEEARAKADTEWDGMAAPKVVLPSLSSSEKKKAAETNPKTKTKTTGTTTTTTSGGEESSISSKPKRKKRKTASPEDEEQLHQQENEKPSKKEKKDKKSKKEKKKKTKKTRKEN